MPKEPLLYRGGHSKTKQISQLLLFVLNSNNISIDEFEGKNTNNYDIETKLSYYNDKGNIVIIKDWGTPRSSNPSLAINFENLL